MFARIILVFALLGGWVTLGVTPASAAAPTGPSSKAGKTSSFVGGAAKPGGFVGTKGNGGGSPNHQRH